MMKLLKFSIYTLFTILLLVICLLYVLLNTNFGLRTTQSFILPYIPGLKIKKMLGSFNQEMQLQGVSYQNDDIQLSINKLIIKWDPLALIGKKLLIHSITVDGIELILLENKKPTTTDKNDYWIKQVDVENISLQQLNIYKNNKLLTRLDSFTSTRTTGKTNSYIAYFGSQAIKGTYFINDLTKWQWQFNANGTNIDTNYLYNGSSSKLSFNLSSAGYLKGADRFATFNLSHLNGTVQSYPATANLQMNMQNDRWRIKHLDAEIGKAFVKMHGDMGEKWNLSWTISLHNLNNINRAFSGQFESTGQVVTKNNAPSITANLRASKLSYNGVTINSINGNVSSFQQRVNVNLLANKINLNSYQFPTAKLASQLKITDKQIATVSVLSLNPDNTLQANINFSNYMPFSVDTTQLSGNAIFKLANINQFITAAALQNINGSINGKVALGGTLSKPTYSGNLTLNDGRFHIPELNIEPHAIQLTAAFNQSLAITLKGSFQSGAGQCLMEGNVDLTQNDYPLTIDFQGTNLQVANTKEYQVTANPNIKLSMRGENASVTGEIDLTHLRIFLKKYYQTVDLPSEFEFVEAKHEVQYFKKLMLQLQVSLGKDAHIVYQNLNASLVGKIGVFQLPGGLPTGQGAIIIKEGTYQIYNKLFRIDQGRLIYMGNLLLNPGLSIHAIQQSSYTTKNFLGFTMSTPTDNLQIGISIGGTLENPLVELVSKPPLNQDDILSQMVFGQSRSNVSSVDALSLLGGLSSSLGLQDPTSGDSEASNSSSIFSVFKMGLLNPTQALNFALPISQHWKLQTETSFSEVGCDLLYNYDVTDKKADNSPLP